MRLIRALIIGALLGFASPAAAQSGCGGQAQANQFCGNGASAGIPGFRLLPPGGTTPINGGTVLGNPTGASALPTATPTPLLGIPGTTQGTLGFSGLTSGTVTLAPQSVAGSVALTLPNTSGTIADGAATPLVLSSTTGGLTCPTCVTSSGGGAITGTLPISVSAAGVVSLATPVSLAFGGTNANLTASNGGILWSNATQAQILAGTATARQMLQSGATATPAWSTDVWPATTAAGTLLTSATANTITASATPTLGVAGSLQGTLGFSGVTSGTATVTAQAAAGSPTLTLPNATGTLADGASAPLALSATTGNLTITGAAGQVLAGATPAFTATPVLGVAGSTVGSLGFQNATSGTSTLQPVTGALGTPVILVPNSSGTMAVSASSPLTLNASTGALACPTCVTSSSLVVGTTAIASGTTTRILFDNAGVLGEYTLTGTGTTVAMSAGPTFSGTVVAPTIAGGTGAASSLLLQSTSGAGTTDFIAFQTASQVERMRILTGGNVGIGTNAPQSLLHINKNATQNVAAIVGTSSLQLTGLDASPTYMEINGFGANPQINMTRSDGTAASKTAVLSNDNLFILNGVGYDGTAYGSLDSAIIVKAAQNFAVGSHGTFVSIFTTPNNTVSIAEAARFQASGGISIGTTTDPGLGSIQVNGQEFIPNAASDSGLTDSTACLRTSNGQILKGSGTLGICLGTSSARYKNNIVDLRDGIDQIDALRAINFNYKPKMGHDPAKVQYGFTAEEVYKVLPKLVDLDDRGRPNTVDILGMVPVLVKAVQQLKADNYDLRRRMEKLESR
jgi:hypothetical protein